MVSHRGTRGPVGSAAEALKDALVAKLQPGLKDSPLNDGIYQSIRLVEGFLNSHKESEAELEALKAQIKRLMMQQITRSPPSRQRPEQGHSSLPGIDNRPSTSPHNDAELAAAAGGNSRLQLYSRASNRSAGAPAGRSASVDWTLPQRTLNRKAYVRGGDFARITLVQDDLARKAEAQRQRDEAERKRSTLAMFDTQMAIVNQRRAEEREARRRSQLEMDEHIRQFQASEEERMRRERATQEGLRDFYTNQVDELHTRQREEAEQREREHAAERAQLEAEARAERLRLEALARENTVLRDRIKRELNEALAAKAAAKAAQVADEARYNREYMAKMDADEAARRRAVEMRAEKMRRAFERAGGVALQENLEEQARLEAARAERLAAEAEAAALEKERRDRERRRREAEETMRTLEQQIAAKQAERAAAAEAATQLRAQMTAAEQAAKAAREVEKTQRRRQQAEALATQKAAVVEQRRRRFEEYRDPVEERYKWLHAAPMAGTQRAFNNLAVPEGKAAMLASMTL
ncbi:hypothetical protein HYH02_007081 [Chlamydomonas schloesseri]|uniref:Trichohyalin-plectin-homology domain-containing protein n=1 Tax=Chlamydomonas schloesseri TaxID=2026947 RepID=A0A835WIX0_9CHLO|nr:hypothetical protein HYH02_007081 [Chlamydomonas schloesseri]|eukprot:KAG2448054.1 hypothetical protein HYH02_007081 [Chlamydomonas schloesseri]